MASRTILLFLLFLSQQCIAQFNTENKQELRKEVAQLINELRASKNLSPLKFNATLLKAAENHSLYLSGTKKLSHWQIDRDLAYPIKRVKYFGGNDFELVGENVLSSKPQKIPLNKKSIKILAQEMYDAWKNSPGHYANMIDVDYTLGDLGFEVDKASNIIYATHVFGKKGIQIPNQLSSNAFGLQEVDEECDIEIFDYYDNIIANLGDDIKIEGNKVMLYYHNKEFFNKIFTDSNDGIAVDLITREQLPCDAPNQLDFSPIYDGILLKPVLIKEILSKNIATSDYRIIAQIGTVPEHLMGKEISASVLVIKNRNNSCAYLNPSYVPRRKYPLLPFVPQLNNPSNIRLSKNGILTTQKLNYEFNTNITTPIEYPEIKDIPHDIHSIDILSYSSIEGNTATNERIHHERAKSIKAHIFKQLSIRESKINIDTKENWDKMNFQLKYYKADHLITASPSSLKSTIAKNDNSLPWKKLLHEQRKSIAIINYHGNIPKDAHTTELAEMNLRMAIKNNNIPLANKALYELFHAEDRHPNILFEEAIMRAISQEEKLIQNAAAVLSKYYSEDIYKTTEIMDSWINKKENLDTKTIANILHLYTLVSIQLLNGWDVSAKRLAQVIPPSRIKTVCSSNRNKHKSSCKFTHHLSQLCRTNK
ncbi:MAG: hypothetical protein ACI94Y_003285 [Maribacter sp.]|jgi:uncharacterized protein YkwD